MTENLEDNELLLENVPESTNLPNENNEDQNYCSAWQIFAFSIGHFYNDLCASMWFTYLMIFLEHVLSFDSLHAGMLMLIGQATDAISTIFVGLLSDCLILPKHIIQAIGRRKSWYILGIFCVTISFSFIFGNCFFCSSFKTGSQWFHTVQLIPFIVIFQFGWACVQISHLALIPELSSNERLRMKMSSFRYGFTVIANLFVFGTVYLLLKKTKTAHETKIGVNDLNAFKITDAIVICLGVLTSSIFIIFLKEPLTFSKNSRSRQNSIRSESSRILLMSWNDWFSHIQFYQVSLLYMFSRLFINISQIYFPFYIVVAQRRSKEFVAILPTVSYIASLVFSSIILPFIGGRINTKSLFMIGAIIGIFNCLCMHFTLPGIDIFGIAILLGLAQSILLISSLGITANLINKNTESGAFVYGFMSFFDKISNGITCQIVEIFSAKCAKASCPTSCSTFYTNIMVFIPGISAVFIFIILMFFKQQKSHAQNVSVEDNPRENTD